MTFDRPIEIPTEKEPAYMKYVKGMFAGLGIATLAMGYSVFYNIKNTPSNEAFNRYLTDLNTRTQLTRQIDGLENKPFLLSQERENLNTLNNAVARVEKDIAEFKRSNTGEKYSNVQKKSDNIAFGGSALGLLVMLTSAAFAERHYRRNKKPKIPY